MQPFEQACFTAEPLKSSSRYEYSLIDKILTFTRKKLNGKGDDVDGDDGDDDKNV